MNNGLWSRIHGSAPSNPGYAIRAELNLNTFKSSTFKLACKKAGIPLTRRQASKYTRKSGKAYKGTFNHVR